MVGTKSRKCVANGAVRVVEDHELQQVEGGVLVAGIVAAGVLAGYGYAVYKQFS